MNLDKVTPELIQNYSANLGGSASLATVKRRLSSLKKFFDWAETEGHIQASPFAAPPLTPASTSTSTRRSIPLFSIFKWIILASAPIMAFLLVSKLQLPIPFRFAPAATPEGQIAVIEPTTEPIPTSEPLASSTPEPTPTSESMTFQTSDTTDGDIVFNPDGRGGAIFLFESPSGNNLTAQNANLTSGSLFYGLVANNATGYNLLTLQSGNATNGGPTTQFAVDAQGNTTVGGNLNLVDGNLLIGGVTRFNSLGRLASITGYYQDSGLFEIDQGAPDNATITKSAVTASSDSVTITLDETGKTSSNYDALVLSRLNAGSSGYALDIRSGNANIAEDLTVGDALNVNGSLTVMGTTIATTGNLETTGDLRVDGNATLGNASNDLITVNGQGIFKHAPASAHTGTWTQGSGTWNVSDSTIYINPASSVGDGNLLGLAVNGSVMFSIDAEGDIFGKNLVLTGTTTTGTTDVVGDLTVEGNTTLGDASGDTLTFNASTLAVPNNLNVDSNTLYIDAANNRVGIGTAAPSTPLDIITGTSGRHLYITDTVITSAASNDTQAVITGSGIRFRTGAGAGTTVVASTITDNGDNTTYSLNQTGLQIGSGVDILWSSTSLYSGTKDLGIERSAASVLGIHTGSGTIFSQISGVAGTATVFNEQGADIDFRVEGDTNTDLLFVDASTDRVGIGTSGPGEKLEVAGNLKLFSSVSDLEIKIADNNVAHGMTTITDTAIHTRIKNAHTSLGGTEVLGISDSNSDTDSIDGVLTLYGIHGWTDPTDTEAAVLIKGAKKSGTGTTNLGDSETVFKVADLNQDLFSILGNGNVGIGTSIPISYLSFGANTGNIIDLWQNGSARYGLGIQSSVLQIYANSSTDRVGIGYGSSASFTETLSVKGSNVGIGITAPINTLDVRNTASAAPATSGTAANGLLRLNSTDTAVAIDAGVSLTNAYSWIQSRATTDYSINYPLAINPNGGSVGIGDVTPDAQLDLDFTGTTGDAFGINSSTVTTGNLMDVTATYVPTGGGTIYAMDVNLTNNPSTNANDFRGLDVSLTDSTALANQMIGILGSVDNSGNTSTGSHTVYAGYFSAAGKTTGTTTGVGISVNAVGFDTNIAAIFTNSVMAAGQGLTDFFTNDTSAADEYFAVMVSDIDGSADNEFLFQTGGTALADGAFTGGGADVAEYYYVKDGEAGDLVSVLTDKNLTLSSGRTYDSNVIGIISTNPGLLAGGGNAEIGESNPNKKPVALAGRVPVKVSLQNGAIKKGDRLTSSSLPGVAMKATKPGSIVAIALEDYDGSQKLSPGTIDIENERLGLDPANQPIPIPPDGIGKIMAFVNISTYEPEPNLAEKFGSAVDYLADAISKGASQTYKDIAGFGELIAKGIKATQIDVADLIASNKIISPAIETSVISPVPDEKDIAIKIGNPNASESGQLLVKNKAEETIASIDEGGNATFSGELKASKVYGQNIDEIQELLQKVDTNNQELLAASKTWEVTTATDSGSFINLTVLKNTILSDTLINGKLNVGTLIFDNSNNSINAAGVLKLQDLALAPIEAMNGKFIIDTQGNVKIAGNLAVDGQTTLKNVKADKVVIASQSEASQSAQVVDNTIETNATAGVGAIKSGVTEITIKNQNITDYTLVYVTPTSETQNQVLYVKEKSDGYFKVGFLNPIDIDATFNWWVIDVN